MSSDQIVLLDIPTKEPRTCWSLNPWKTRMLLNYKGLDYKTEWVEYPDIKGRLEPHVPPNPEGTPYTLPAVQLPDGRYTMESRAIADQIEALHPSPPAHLDSPALAKLQALVPRLQVALRPVYMPRVPRLLLAEGSAAYFRATRAALVGMELDAFEAANPEAGVWDTVEPLLREVTALLEEEGGPFFLGAQVSYADFVWGGLLLFYERLGALEELLRRSGNAEVHRRLLEGLQPWTKRNAD
ncbi:b5c5e312-99ed-4ce0-a515-0ea22776eefb [Thermothielavioides terrestris]|uniref:B5c5e312-99ed-4ce0-a515-0ea22776eefb n=1 Tax=Thermothielavioides terrestris TaxID=2587410 RepID=A0A3S4AI18_9PEZI|nr:b5c5e312-99ed-4ce0-a515-0ea22776eefb [Thermothielavioides terrestris]